MLNNSKTFEKKIYNTSKSSKSSDRLLKLASDVEFDPPALFDTLLKEKPSILLKCKPL